MKPNILATFERKSPGLDSFLGELDEWQEVTKAWVWFVYDRGSEVKEDAQNRGYLRQRIKAPWTPLLDRVDTACRMIANDRTYQIEQKININEQNRQVEFAVVEKV